MKTRLHLHLFHCLAILTAIFLTLTTTHTFAQSSSKKIQFGFKAGANFSQLDNLSFSTPRLMENGAPVLSGGAVVYDFFQQNNTRTTGIVGGVFARFGNTFFIQPELLVSAKGGTFDIIRQGLATQSVTIRTTSVDLPLLIGFRVGPLHVNAGPMASLALSESTSFKQAIEHYTTQSIDKTVQQAVFGYQAGAGIRLAGVQLDVRYEGNLSDLSSVGIKTPANDTRFSTKASLWQITAGFGF